MSTEFEGQVILYRLGTFCGSLSEYDKTRNSTVFVTAG